MEERAFDALEKTLERMSAQLTHGNATRDQQSNLLASLQADVRHMSEEVTKLRHSVHGNGDPGLKSRLEVLEAKMAPIWAALGTAGVGVVTAVMALVLK